MVSLVLDVAVIYDSRKCLLVVSMTVMTMLFCIGR